MSKEKKRKKLPFKKLWEKQLNKDFGKICAQELLTKFQTTYDKLCRQHKPIDHPRLRKHLYDNILPQVAAYKTLLTDNDQETAFQLIQKLHFLTLARLKWMFQVLVKLPFCFPYLRVSIPVSLKLNHPPEGWDIEYVENSKTCFHTKVYSCFYHEVFKEYGIPELSLIYCNGDDYTFDVPSPYIKWGRTSTVTRGGDYCDVIFHRVNRKNRKTKRLNDRNGS